MPLVIDKILENSISDEIGLKPEDEILSLNSKVPKDIIEYSFLMQDELINLEVKRKNGDIELFEIEKDFEEDLGISFTSAVFDKVKLCRNKCIFCFVDQQPKGLRKSLYVKDDDWRLSYLQGTYITLTNLDNKDWEEIEKFHPSPLYVSVHTTNPDVRAKMLNNKKAATIMQDLKRFAKLKIEVHAQIVLCPNYNDGEELRKTLLDLTNLKNVKSTAVVPLGISRYRVENLKSVDSKIALETIQIAEEINKKIKKNSVNLSDEFFVLANLEIPPRKYYRGFAQIEDGVGAIRLLLDDFKKQLPRLKKELKKDKKLSVITGKTAAKIFGNIKKEIKVKGLTFDVIEVKNRFFGDSINVAGLVTGKDIIETLKGKSLENITIPSLMLRDGTEEFLDGTTIDDIKKATGANIFIIKDCYSFREVANIINMP